MHQTLVLDTSLFVNPASAHAFGSSPTEAFRSFLEQAKQTAGVTYLMPPSIYKELMFFADESALSKTLLLAVEQRAPQKHEIKLPGIFVYQLVDDMRDRVDRGLRLAERHVREALQKTPQPVQAPAGREVRADAEIISRLRESYRRIMREGMLDSKADCDLLLLTYEVKGTLVSADQGVLTWAENLGLSILPHDQLPVFLRENSKK